LLLYAAVLVSKCSVGNEKKKSPNPPKFYKFTLRVALNFAVCLYEREEPPVFGIMHISMEFQCQTVGTTSAQPRTAIFSNNMHPIMKSFDEFTHKKTKQKKKKNKKKNKKMLRVGI
jgi:hypothetical protein